MRWSPSPSESSESSMMPFSGSSSPCASAPSPPAGSAVAPAAVAAVGAAPAGAAAVGATAGSVAATSGCLRAPLPGDALPRLGSFGASLGSALSSPRASCAAASSPHRRSLASVVVSVLPGASRLLRQRAKTSGCRPHASLSVWSE